MCTFGKFLYDLALGGYPMENRKNIGLRVLPEVHRKLQYIARYEGRTINGQVGHLIQTCIRQFEREHGPIQVEGDHAGP